ncbi:MAG: hypothetical protein WC645_07755 [Candidatus Margulisiibacteriota bacterium]
MSEKRVSGASSRSSGPIGRMGPAVPAGLSPILRRFWDYARDTAKKFSKHLMDPDKYEDEFLSVIRRDFEKWE